MRLCCSQTTEDKFFRVKAQLTYVSIGTNSVDQNQNAPTLYINRLIWFHTACKKATVYFSKQRQIYIEEHGSVVECVTRDRLHVLTRLIVCEYVFSLSIWLCDYVRACLSVGSSRGKNENVQITCKSARARNICIF